MPLRTSPRQPLHTAPLRTRRALGAVATIAVAVVGLAISSAPVSGQTKVVGPTLPPRTATTKAATATTKRSTATTVRRSTASASRKTATTKRATTRRTTATARRATSGGSSSGSSSSTGLLKKGSSGDAVLELTDRLATLKFDVEPSEVFGDQVFHAVMAFQKAYDLPRTGQAGSLTMAKLETALPVSPLLPDGGANRVEIDLEKQYLALYQNSELFKVVSISSGNGERFCEPNPATGAEECDRAVTPGGSFRVSSRIIGWRESRLGLLHNPLYFNGGIAIHGSPSVPATPASHGCVRIPMVTSEWFNTEVPNSTPVYVFNGENAPPPFQEKEPTDLVPNATGPTTTTDAPGAATPTTRPAGGTPSPTVAGATTVPGASTVPGATTLPGATTVPGASTIPGSSTTSTTTTTQPSGIVRVVPGPTPTTAPSTVTLAPGTVPIGAVPTTSTTAVPATVRLT